MTKLTKYILALISIFGVASSAYAVTAVGNASATVSTALTVTQNSALSFGEFSVGGTGGTVTTAGAVTGDVVHFNTAGARAGAFVVTAEASSTLNVTVAPNVTLSNGGNTMTAALVGPTTLPIDTNGSGSFTVTGTLTVAGSQPNGNYAGTYNININYQ